MSAEGQGEFAGSGAVGRYWQTRCCGFEVRSVRGRRLGTVAALELDPESRATVTLVVQRRRRRPLRVRADAVGSVDPWRCSLVVAVPRRRPRRVPVGRVAAWTGRTSARSAVTLARGSRRAVVWAVPRALFAVGLAAWTYAVVVFAAVRVAIWLLVALTTGTARGGARLKPHVHGVR